MKNISVKNINQNFIYLIILLLPIIIISKSSYLNAYTIISTIISFIIIIKFKKNPFLDNAFIIIFFFWLSLVINCLTNLENTDGIVRSITFFRFIGLYFFLNFYISSYETQKQKMLFTFWSLVFLLISCDLIYEFINGENVFGNKSGFMGRLSGFMGNELKIGHYYFSFSLITIATLKLLYFPQKKDEYLFLFIGIFILSISFIIGERSNFLKNFLAFFFYFFLIFKDQLKKSFIFFTVLCFVLLLMFKINPYFKDRYVNEIIKPISKGFDYFYKNSHYGSHAYTAIEIFKNNKIFGTGIKNFRNESKKETYFNREFKYSKSRASTHPHNYLLEFLSETGIIGTLFYIIFIIFTIKLYIKKKAVNQINTVAFITLLSTMFPLLPSGSFLTTYNAFIFFSIYSLIFCKIKF